MSGSASFATPGRGMFRLRGVVACLALILFVLASSEVSARKEVDSDLVFEDVNILKELDKKVINVDHRHKREKSIHPQENPDDNHWLLNTVHRIKRGFFDSLWPIQSAEEPEKSEEQKPHSREIRSSNEEKDENTTHRHHPPEDDDLNEIEDIEPLPIHNALPAYKSQKQIVGDDEDDLEERSGDLPEGSAVDPGHVPGQPSYYRLTLSVQEPWVDQYANRASDEFTDLATTLAEEINRIYEPMPGRQSATVIRIQPTTDPFFSLVTVDLGSVDYYDMDGIKNRLYDQIQKYHSLGQIAVGTTDFTFRKFEVHHHVYCQPDELPCRSGECVASDARCNGTKECSDGSDEMGCRDYAPRYTSPAPSTEHEEHEETTAYSTSQPSYLHTSTAHSSDDIQPIESEHDSETNFKKGLSHTSNITHTITPESSTIPVPIPETIDRCRADDKVRCGDSSVYVCTDQQCDGNNDCPYGEDEEDCDYECATSEFMCDISRCIPDNKVCDGVKDCDDGTDEHCPAPECTSGQFRCNDGTCIDENKKCDKQSDCSEGEDERGCPTCSKYEFTCTNGVCIDISKRCDGRYDCSDSSDERDCAPCEADDIRCGDGSCVPKSARCDNIFDCVDGVDERDCLLCSPDQFRCENGQCISEHKRCDGHPDCADGSDELSCACRPDQFQCANGVCVTEAYRCDGVPDCTDGSDELNCSPHCEPDEFQCSDRRCISALQKCDGLIDCPDGGDEHNCPPRLCSKHEFSCGDGYCIPLKFVCDRRSHCRDGSDERDCDCQPNEFKCRSDECISNILHCDGHRDCYDGSDEINCTATTTTEEPTESPWPTQNPYVCGPGQWQCRSGECIPHSALCDNRYDCNDYSDETSCSGSGLNLRTYPDEQIIKESREVVFQCRDEGPLRARVRWVRGDNLPLPPGSRDINGRLEMPDIQVEHSGPYTCEAVGYAPHTPGSRVTVSLTVEPFERPTHPPHKACELYEATCSNGDCISKSMVCDGNFDCTDGSDETRCNQHGCEPNEFRCNNKRCILKTWRCDSDDDCGDGSDEANCSTNPPGSPCRFHEFQCRSGNQCIPKSFHCDLERDCVDGSDEIGCSNVHIQTPPPPMITLEVGSVFEITCKAVGVPTPEVIWRLNWGHIPEKCTTKSENGLGTLTCPNIQEHDQGAYSCEAINIRGSQFAVPDTILTVKRPGNVCPAGYFNDEARSPSECISCFCFGATTECQSANLFTYQLHPPFDSYKLTGVRVDPSTGGIDIRDEPVYRGTQPRIQPFGRSGVQIQSSPYSQTDSNTVPYFAMPENYHGNQLKSYGGFLKYTVKYSGPNRPNSSPDIILSGNGYTLAHISHPLEPDREHTVSARFFVGEWVKRSANAPEQMATREEIMMALASVDNILIKLQYTSSPQVETTISNIEMDSAAVRNTGQGQAHYVEECKCPVGYTGLSCENCAVGYTRHMSGPWLGKCYKEEETCQPGTYGDPNRGIPCEVCPCPLTNPSNQFARTCHLGSDGLPTCDCPPGYVGRRCEQCASGYTGNPLIPGDSCQPGICDPAGSRALVPDSSGQCPCKLYTTGPTCNQCKPNKFNLSPDNQFGCVACFCMGITQQCTSSNWYRDTISTVFTRSRNDFKLVESLKKKEHIEDGIRLDSGSRAIVYDEFSRRRPDVYYWSLPSRYLGDKISSYGGHLNYTLRYVPAPGGLSSRNTAPDVEIISANDIILMYFGKDQPQPNIPQSFSVPLLEQHWQRSDGKKADREHLLMALADLEAILIKATYTTNTREAALIAVSLDIADERNTGRERALPVEQCHCPVGYRGLSCEDCDFGYTRAEFGLYLGLCEPCNCNGHSSECDAETGVCSNCRDHTTGDFCNECMPGYEGDASQGTPYDCRPTDPSEPCKCNIAGSMTTQCYGRQCSCKPNVEGNQCDRCRKGTFGLTITNPEGCSECFCSGVTDQCGESTLYREQIPSQIIDGSHGFILTDQFQREHISDGFQLNVALNEIGYLMRPSANKRLFWSLPSSFTGDKIASYGGRLEYIQRYTERPGAQHSMDMDVLLTGNGVTIYWSNPERLVPDRQNNVSVIISASENWQRYEHHSGPRRASRDDILTALANLDAILIRASQSSDTSSTYISDITLDTAVPQYTGQSKATEVENCKCPPGYRGTSCELCSSGYYRDVNDRSAGPLGSCQRCPCSGNEQSCALGQDGRVVCSCLPGYYGERCETTEIPTTEPPYDPSTPAPPTIEVTISAPTIQIVDIGSILRLHCQGRSLVSSPIQLRWYKRAGVLPPDRAIDDHRGYLTVRDVLVSDSGVYICEASDGISIVSGNVTVIVGGNEPEPPRVRLDQPYITVTEGEPIEIRATLTGIPHPTADWTRDQNERLNPEHTVYDGILRIPYSRKSDEGLYIITVRNSAGIDSATISVYVREGLPPADLMQLDIDPKQYTGPAGQHFTLTCTASPGTVRSLSWSKIGGPIPYHSTQREGVFTVYNPKPEDSGTYVCNGTSMTGKVGSAQVRVSIITETLPPTVHIEPDKQTVAQGTVAELRCIASGTPTPSVKWTKVGEEFGPNVQETGQYLRITNVQVRDRGVYVCVAHNEGGLVQASSIVEVEQREPPAIEIYPSAHQTLTTGASTLLQCRIKSGIPQPKVKWSRPHGQPLSRNIEELSGGVLRITQVTMQEDGEYICHAENEAGQTTATAKIDVQSLPTITISPHSGIIYVREGERVRLECHATGLPAPSVHWSKHDHYPYGAAAPAYEQHRAVYEITSVTRNDQGSYICFAQNAAGATEDRVQLIVEEYDRGPIRGDIAGEDAESENEYPSTPEPKHGGTGYPHTPPYGPEYPHERQPPTVDEFTVPVGARAEMRCRIQAVNYPENFYFNWIRSDNSSLPADSAVRGGILYINNVQPSAAGEYTCLGISQSGSVLFTQKARLRVSAPPRITLSPPRQVVRPGDNAHISCTATGDQPIEINWLAMNRQLPRSAQTSGGQLQFYGIQRTDAGRYICTAKNAAGEADAVAEVIVNEHQHQPTISAENRVHEALVGSSAQLHCRVTDYTSSRPTVRWTRDRQALPPNALVRGEVLQLVDIQMSDAGRYVCEITNEYGSSRDFINLVVNYPHREPEREALVIEPSSNQHHTADTLDLNCRSSEPGTQIRWSKLSGRLADNVYVSGPNLRISSLRPENEGYYRCEANGYHGVQTKDYEIVLIDDSPHADERPVETKTAPQGSTVVMDCRTDLQQPVTYQWSKQGGSLPHDTNTETARLQLRDIKASDAGTYICTASNADATIDLPTILVVTGIVPFFSQAPSSYIALPTLPDAYLHFNFEVSFKPETPNGLILYNGQKKNNPTGDFISLVLKDGYPEFRFSCGSGPALIRGDKRLELGQWHTIKVSRSRREGKMFVNGHGPYAGQSAGKNQGLDLMEPLYIGGVPNYDEISPRAGSTEGFVGCVSRLVVGRTPHDLMREATAKTGITTCETCTENPCQNQGVCQEAQTKEGYTCLCPTGFSGPTCGKVGEACYPDVCGTGRCVDKEDGFDCYCPLGKTGNRCERDTTIYEPAFSNNAYIAYPTPNPQRRLKMNLKIKPKDLKDGVLLYCGESEEGYGHFTSLTLKNRHLEYRFDSGAGPVVIRSAEELKPNEWVAVTVSKFLGEGKLVVNGQTPVSGRSGGAHRPLSLHTPLYVGGYDRERIKLNPGVEVEGGFDGCVSAIDISGANLNLITSVMDSANVQDCSDFDSEQNSQRNDIDYSHNELDTHSLQNRYGNRAETTACSSNPCRNDGHCYSTTPYEYSCSCINGYSGRDCEIAPNLCDQLQPCQNGGTCHGNTTKYKCDCTLGYTGLNCEQRIDIRSDVSFAGDGYLELPRSLLPHTVEDENEIIALVISTNKSDGLIFWHGQDKDVDGRGQDFVSLAIVGGYLEFSYDLGSGEAHIQNKQIRVDDGHRHSVVLKRQELDGSLEVDHDFTEFGTAEGLTYTMNCDGSIYLGGVPNLSLMTGGKFTQGFDGCIHAFELQENSVDLGAKALSGLNIKPCSSSDNDEENNLDEDNEDDFVNK